MEKYLIYIREFQNDNEFGKYFVENQLQKHLEKNSENQTEIEHILDYLYSTKKKFDKVGYITISEKAKKWNDNLQKKASAKDNEVVGKDIEVLKKWKNGFKIVKLISKESFVREGKLMSHCCGGYYGRGVEIYSLRDEKNLPHCTMEKNNQIKGKGNGNIIPKYIKYVVEFLEEIGMEVRDSEMKNLGYINIADIQDKNAVFPDLFRDKYFYKENDILDEKGNKYESVSLWNVFGLLKINTKFEINFKFNIQNSIDTFLRFSDKKVTAVANESYSTAVANKSYGTAVANKSYGTAVANKSYGTAVANESYSTAVANGHYSTAVANGHSSTAVANESYSTAVANKSYGTAVANESNSVALLSDGRESKIKANIGSCIIIVERDENGKIIGIISKIVDGKKIKANVFYQLKKGKLIELKSK